MAFLSPPLTVKVKSCLGAPVAAWQVRVEEGSIYVGCHLPLVYNEMFWWSPMKKQSVKAERALHTRHIAHTALLFSDAAVESLFLVPESRPPGVLTLINVPLPSGRTEP